MTPRLLSVVEHLGYLGVVPLLATNELQGSLPARLDILGRPEVKLELAGLSEREKKRDKSGHYHHCKRDSLHR